MFPMKTYTYSHGNDSIFMHGLSLEIDSHPQSNHIMKKIKLISNHEPHTQAKSKKKSNTLHTW